MPVPSTQCEWHGRCKECVALHRHHGDHVPFCLQPIIRKRVRALADACEMEPSHKPPTPDEYRAYVRERDAADQA